MRTGTLNLSNFATKKLRKRILQNFIMFYIYVYVYIYIYLYKCRRYSWNNEMQEMNHKGIY